MFVMYLNSLETDKHFNMLCYSFFPNCLHIISKTGFHFSKYNQNHLNSTPNLQNSWIVWKMTHFSQNI